MIKISDKKQCCGCEACVQACPKQCIDFTQDAQGFFYPSVNEDKCVDCGLCNKVCPILNVEDYRLPPSTPVFAAYNNDDEQRRTGSSGGIFELLALETIKNKGIVFGAVFNEEWNVVHGYAETEEQIEALKRSKYVQSRIGTNYKQVKSFLIQGKQVLFVGTPCQIAGLKHYLRKDYENLITVDVVCHGVPSPMIWKKYLAEKKKEIACKYNANEGDVLFKSISFRDKVKSWRRYHLTLTYGIREDGIDAIGSDSIVGTASQYVWENDYMLSFLHDFANRPSCFDCKFRNGKCRSDLTLADFWGIEKLTNIQELKEDKGTSLIMAHTDKGQKIIMNLPCFIQEFAFRVSLWANPAVFYNWPKPISYNLFFKECKKHSLKYAFGKAHKIQVVYELGLKIKKKIYNIKKLWQK